MNWGIVATGRIAELFCEDLVQLDQADTYAVASRAKGKAQLFAQQFGFVKAYDSYHALYQDPQVDVVYIATPHAYHYENTKAALLAGKHVLSEKAFTLNAWETQDLISTAREQKRFLMDAMWNRFLPAYTQLKKIIKAGTIGDILHIEASLCFQFPFDPKHRLFNPELGGGALLDLGVYPLTFASWFAGHPLHYQLNYHLADSGVDDEVNILAEYPDNVLAHLSCSSRYSGKNHAIIYGTKGSVELPGFFIRPQTLRVSIQGESEQDIATPYTGNGYGYEAQAVMDAIGLGQLEHTNMPLSETLAVMEFMDDVRRDMDVVYPNEHKPNRGREDG